MPDLASPYTLTTPGGTVQFNNEQMDRFNIPGGPDEFYISDIQGLDGPPIRAPVDNRPQTDGGLVHPFFKGPRRVTIEGCLMIRSTRIGDAMRLIRNDMEKELKDALESILAADGTLSWTVPYTAGTDAFSLTVRNEIPVEFRGIELKTFVFGLIAADPDYDA